MREMSRDSFASTPLTSKGVGLVGGVTATADALDDTLYRILPKVFPTPKRLACPNTTGWLKGTCAHGNVRWVRLSCKRRDCEVCGELRRQRIAYRVAFGIEVLGHAAWFVGTWDWNIPKAKAVQTQNKFVQWLRRDQGLKVQYAACWEEHKSGRLHLNLILAPWKYINQRTLSQKWTTFGGGPIVWIERAAPTVSGEVIKPSFRLGNYMAKFEQQVRTGRGITYSKLWPKLPESPISRKGHIDWVWLMDEYDEAREVVQDISLGFMAEVIPGEYTLFGEKEDCDCFEYALEAHRGREDIIDLAIVR